MAAPTVDTADYQRGVVSAQKLLYHGTITDPGFLVGVPPNAETIVIMSPTAIAQSEVTVIGDSSGMAYPVASIPHSLAEIEGRMFLAPAAAAVDPIVQIASQSAGLTNCSIYADAGVRTTTDPALSAATISDGEQQYIATLSAPIDPNIQNTSPLPVVATETTGDVVWVSNATQLIAAPSVGANYIFGWSCQNNSTDSGQAACVLWAGTKTIDYLGIPGSDGNASDAHSFGHPFRTVEAVLFGIYGPSTPVGRAILLYAPGP